ncbi:hypothetical protein LZP73_13840 [Shewanella sp. AS16]|uniref:cold adaptation protein AtcA n=1 Tax=Shewanella sp. AS16 TaxID=2907625 RepID=UPI001F2B43D1|nr:hypothetical protein [Shewanella sp. AS16]MCE9687274.1 hypothetical protein [Shewanella sp. AS16]
MAQQLNISRINELKDNAYDNIMSYDDPDTPQALSQFTGQIRGVLLADPKMLASVPEYLPLALFERVKFPSDAKGKWADWLSRGVQPEWDEFKVSIAFNNADLPLVLAVRAYSEALLVESCAVLYLLETQGKQAPVAQVEEDDSDLGTDYGSGYGDDDEEDSDEEGYYDRYDDEENY